MDAIQRTEPESRIQAALKSFSMHLLHMMGFRSITGNLIAIALCGFIFATLHFNWLMPNLGKATHYVYFFLGALVAIQVLRSSAKSLLLPFMCILSAGVVLTLEHFHLMALSGLMLDLRYLMLLGLAGLCISIFNIR